MSRNDQHAPALEAPYDELLDWARAAYGVAFEPVRIDDVGLEFLQIADMEAHLDHLVSAAEPGQALVMPLWAKIWPSALITAHFLRRQPPRPGQPLLEIGSGVGVCGLFAAAFGSQAMVSDITMDALRFARINVLHNNLADRVTVARINFATDRLPRRFSRIVGSEILYLEPLHAPLLGFLQAHLAPDPEAEAFLSCNYLRNPKAFFALAEPLFRVQTKTIGCKSAEPDQAGQPQRHLINIHRLARKAHA